MINELILNFFAKPSVLSSAIVLLCLTYPKLSLNLYAHILFLYYVLILTYFLVFF